MVKNSPAKAGDVRTKEGFDPWVGKIPWRRAWQPTPVFLPGESHGQRSLAGYSPWGRRESDTQSCIHINNYGIYNEQDAAKYFSHNMCNPLHSPMKGMLLSTFYK